MYNIFFLTDLNNILTTVLSSVRPQKNLLFIINLASRRIINILKTNVCFPIKKIQRGYIKNLDINLNFEELKVWAKLIKIIIRNLLPEKRRFKKIIYYIIIVIWTEKNWQIFHILIWLFIEFVLYLKYGLILLSLSINDFNIPSDK